jgi:hypothetical protein
LGHPDAIITHQAGPGRDLDVLIKPYLHEELAVRLRRAIAV